MPYEFFRKKIRHYFGLDALYELIFSVRVLVKEIQHKMSTAQDVLNTISQGLVDLKDSLATLSADLQTAVTDLKTQIGRDMPQLDTLQGIATAVSGLSDDVKKMDDAVKAADPSAFTPPAPTPTPTPAPLAKQAIGIIPLSFPFAGILNGEGIDTFEELRDADLTKITLPEPVAQSRQTITDALAAADAAANA